MTTPWQRNAKYKMTRVWLSVSINGAILDRIVIQLFTEIVPKTCEK